MSAQLYNSLAFGIYSFSLLKEDLPTSSIYYQFVYYSFRGRNFCEHVQQ